MKKTPTALLSFGALVATVGASLLLAGCDSGSKTGTPATAAATPPSALPAPTQYDAETFFATTSYIMPQGYAWSADDKQLLVTSDETGIYNVYGLPAAGEGKQALTSSTTDSTFAVSWFPADPRALFTADSGGDEINLVDDVAQRGALPDQLAKGTRRAALALCGSGTR